VTGERGRVGMTKVRDWLAWRGQIEREKGWPNGTTQKAEIDNMKKDRRPSKIVAEIDWNALGSVGGV